jgi:hypothetical protein
MTTPPVENATELQAACQGARPGHAIKIRGGDYRQRTTLKGVHGKRGSPIVISAADDRWICGDSKPDPMWSDGNPAMGGPGTPGADDFAFLALIDCSHIVIEGLAICGFWPSIFFIKDSRYLTIRNCVLRHGTFAVYAKGEKTSHLNIDCNEWQQDDSESHRLWTEIDWKRAHGNEGSDGLCRYFNGGFLSAKGIRGNVVVRRNRIMDAYNGIRLKSGNETVPLEKISTVNANVHIFDNEFIRIRDNPIEPEVSAYNWHVRHNRLLDCHSWFSFDGVGGGYWYFYGNRGRFESRQGLPDAPSHTMGRVLKLSYERRPRDINTERVPSLPWYVFNNSWYLRCPLVGGAAAAVPARGEGPDFTARLDFFNNAIAWCQTELYDDWTCQSVDLVRHFDWYRSASISFDYDICDRADFLGYFRDPAWGELNGLIATRPIFVNAPIGDFHLAESSEARGSGIVRPVEHACPTAQMASMRSEFDGKISRGACQDYGLISIPELEAQAERILKEVPPGSNVDYSHCRPPSRPKPCRV